MILLIEWIFEVPFKKNRKKEKLSKVLHKPSSLNIMNRKQAQKGEKIIAAKKVTPLPAQASL